MIDTTDFMEDCAYGYMYLFICIYMPVLPHADRKALREALCGVFKI